MTNCSFMCKDEHSADELMDKIWEAIRYWIEFERKEMILCKWRDKEGYQVAVSAADKAKISMALSFKATENPEEGYELSIDKDGKVKNIRIPTDVIGKMYYDRSDKYEEIRISDIVGING